MTTPAPPVTFTNFRIIPLLASDDVRVLRVTGFHPPSFTPGSGPFTGDNLQDQPVGPPGWHTTTYDDSAWSRPVLAEVDPFAGDQPITEFASGGITLAFDADPLWITPTPTDPDEVILIRWWITPPPDPAFAFASPLINRSPTLLNRFQFGLNDEPFGFGLLENLNLGQRNLLTFAIPNAYRGLSGTQTVSYWTTENPNFRWVRLGVLFASLGAVATYCHRPMLVSDDVKMLRVTTPPTEPSQLPTPFGGVLNPDAFGPAGWNLAGFDDTAWTSAVLIDPVATTHFAPLHYSMRTQVAGLPNEPIQGDPLWDQPMPELDLAAVVLVRWHFDVPPQANPDLAQFAYLFYNTAHGQQGPTAGYLNLVANDDDPVLGDDITSGASGIGGIVPGAQNVLAVIWGVYSNPLNDTGRFVLLDIVYQCSGTLGAGDSTTRSWGSNAGGKLGVGDIGNRYEPTQLVFDGGFAEVVSAQDASWGRIDGLVYAWGDNTYGSLGIGASGTVPHIEPELIEGLVEVIALAAGSSFNGDIPGARCFAVTVTGDLYAWGENNLGELGLDDQSNRNAPTLTNTNVAKVSTGCRHSVLLKVDGSVWATGDGGSGALGLNPGAFTFRRVWAPTFVPTAARVLDVLAGSVCTWALCADGTVWGTGSSQRGELGLTTGSMQWVALPVLPDGRLVALIGTAGRTLFMVADDGSVWALGDNARGGLGSGSLDPDFETTPVPVMLPGATQLVRSGRSEFPSAIALGSDGQVYTWGDGLDGQMGNGTIVPDNEVPIAATVLSGAEWIGGASPSFFAGVGFVPPPVVGRRGRSTAQIIS